MCWVPGVAAAVLLPIEAEPHTDAPALGCNRGVMTYVAYRGLDSWTFIGIGWLLHTAWDLVHHLKGNPILPFYHDSSMACAICDPVIALWCFRGGPSLIALVRGWFGPGRTTDHAHGGASATS